MLVAIAVDEGKPFLSLYGLGISFAILLCLAMLLAGLFWRHVSVQSISVSPAGIHAVVWLSMRIGLPRRRLERTIAWSNIQAMEVLSVDNGATSSDTGKRVVPTQDVDGLDRFLDIDLGSEAKAAAFVVAVRAIRAQAV